MYGVNIEEVNLKDRAERGEVEAFLQSFDLRLDRDVDYTIVIRETDGNSNVVATCSKAKNVFKCFAVLNEFQGEGITSLLITHLIDKLFSQGIYHSFIFTKPVNTNIFTTLNFKLIHSNADVALLEYGLYDIRKSLREMKEQFQLWDGEKAALVMNCNPFTRGHQFLIEEASRNNHEVLVFVVEEDQSLFPFKVRFELVRQGVASLRNVKVIPSGEYIISSATFPSYFLKQEDVRLKAYTELDAGIFGRYFGEILNITKRYVGEEPFCPVTDAYNKSLKRVLPGYGVEVIEVPRRVYRGCPISATRVRALLQEVDFSNSEGLSAQNDRTSMENFRELTNLLPEVTLEFLKTPPGRKIIEKLKQGYALHPSYGNLQS